ncbi:MAG: fluoride efflux transporter CrcB [Candidatus Thioglobus sp.]|nr:fluoride efflux transporter CrcB [Candidatus Thioglobus sp.]
MNFLPTILVIGIGATIGASLRYYLGLAAASWLGAGFAYGTLIANVTGAFIAGIFVVIILEKSLLSDAYRLLLLVGLCGSLTTFSAFSIETLQFLQANYYLKAGLNIGLNVGLSLLALAFGASLTKIIL